MMKKQIIFVLLVSFQAAAQNPKFPKQTITVPCNQEFLDNYKGKWLIPDKTLTNRPNQAFSLETIKRMGEIHKLVEEVYPQPIAVDAKWSSLYVKTHFGNKIKYVTVDGNSQMEYVTTNQVEGWIYNTTLFPWSCSGTHEISNGYPEISGGNGFAIDANHLPILSDFMADGDEWTVDGLPIKRKMPTVGNWKGYEMLASNGGPLAQQNDQYFILISRNDMLPYILVTRKQYLDRAMAYATRFYDNLNVINEKIRDKTEKEEGRNRNLKAKNAALKKLQDELEKTRRDGLLDAPAIVGTDPLMMNEGPVFLPESEGGIPLTIENPDYFRKNLPGYIPQVFVVSWSWGKEKFGIDFKKAIETNFPVEKLKAMIDK